MIVFNNLGIKDSDLLINVEGFKEKQHITAQDLIQKCKLKKKILDRSWNETDANRMTEPLEPRKKIFRSEVQIKSANIKLFAGPESTYRAISQPSTTKTGHIMFPGQDETKRVTVILDEEYLLPNNQDKKETRPEVHDNHHGGIGLELDSISEASNSYVMVEYGLNPYERKKLTRRKSCLCRHQDIIFHDTKDAEFTDTFMEDILARVDHYYLDREVPRTVFPLR